MSSGPRVRKSDQLLTPAATRALDTSCVAYSSAVTAALSTPPKILMMEIRPHCSRLTSFRAAVAMAFLVAGAAGVGAGPGGAGSGVGADAAMLNVRLGVRSSWVRSL